MRTSLAIVLAVASLSTHARARSADAQRPDQPTFRTGTALLTIDVSVVDDDWQPVTGLTPSDFEVELDGDRRPVRAIDYVSFGPRQTTQRPATAGLPSPSGPVPTETRTLLLLGDDRSFAPGEGTSLFAAARRFIGTLAPTDRVGVVSSGGRAVVAPTVDRAPVIAALRSIRGSYQSPQADVQNATLEGRQVALSEAVQIARGDNSVTIEVARREVGESCVADPGCLQEVAFLAAQVAHGLEGDVARQLHAWTAIAEDLSRVAGSKVMVILSGGLASDAYPTALQAFGRVVATSGIGLHILGETRSATSAESAMAGGSRGTSEGLYRKDNALFRAGLQEAAGIAGGAFQEVVGQADRNFSRVLSASSAKYRLGVEVPPGVEPGTTLKARVRLKRSGLTIHAASAVTAPGPPVVLTADEQLKLAIGQGRQFFGVPITMTPLVRRSTDGRELELGLHFEVPVTASLPLDVVFAVMGDAGRVVQSGRTRIDRTTGDLQHRFSLAVPVPPGNYRLRAAVADSGGSVGSLEQSVAARLSRMGSVLAGQVTARWAGPDDRVMLLATEPVPETAARLDVGAELYRDHSAQPPRSAIARVKLDNADGTRLLGGEIPLAASETAWYAGLPVPLETLQPGSYVVTVEVEEDGRVVGVASRRFTKTSPVVASLPTPDAVLAVLRQDTSQHRRAFEVAPFLTRDMVAAQVAAVARGTGSGVVLDQDMADADFWGRLELQVARSGAVGSFVQGLIALNQQDTMSALSAFERSLEGAPDSASVMLYIGAASAAMKRDRDAIGAWELALADPAATVEWHLAHADALVRAQDPSGALNTMTNAAARWPDVGRIAVRRGELLLAAGGFEEGRKVLEAALQQAPDDGRTLFLLTALAFADVLREPSSVGARAAFDSLSDRYLKAPGSQPSPVVEWRHMLNQPTYSKGD